ncbi:MAG: Rieske (2Fe-2S) protein [Candidatus Hydrogenedentes bacterium]|jgi:nitrite reductase (NADH) small subunit|nr:Rieske (2Fe-2S) protein [Candidatus Hydrogenedentota bacterium]
MIQFVKVAKKADFAGRKLMSVRILGRPVALIQEDDGTIRAMEAGCKHQNADLTKGTVKNGILTCPWHGWQYELETGRCVSGGTARLRAYACKVEGDDIFISLRPEDTDFSSEPDWEIIEE